MTPEEARQGASVLLGLPALRATRLAGGLLNHVFRVEMADGRTVIWKHAPPHVAAAPDIPLDPRRASVEAAALAQVGPPTVPRLLAHAGPTLVLEDLGPLPHLGQWLRGGGDRTVLDGLARWLRRLHEGAPPSWVNPDVQQIRMATQYRRVEPWLAAAGVAEAAALGARVVALGERWLEPGPCFVMGDLWPPSVLVRDAERFHLIDWELSTPGWPAQDLGHLVAHLRIGACCGEWEPGLAARFLQAYGDCDAATVAALTTHAGAEVVARALGPFARAELDPAARARLIAAGVALLKP